MLPDSNLFEAMVKQSILHPQAQRIRTIIWSLPLMVSCGCVYHSPICSLNSKVPWLTDCSRRCTLSTLGPGWRTTEVQWYISETKDWTSIKYTTGGWAEAIEESSAMYHINSLWRRMPARSFILLNAGRYPSSSYRLIERSLASRSRLMTLSPCAGSWYKSMAEIW